MVLAVLIRNLTSDYVNLATVAALPASRSPTDSDVEWLAGLVFTSTSQGIIHDEF